MDHILEEENDSRSVIDYDSQFNSMTHMSNVDSQKTEAIKEKEDRKKQIEEMQRQKEAVALATQNRLLYQQRECYSMIHSSSDCNSRAWSSSWIWSRRNSFRRT